MEKIKAEGFAAVAGINMVLTNCFGKMTVLLYLVISLMGLDLVTRIYAAGMSIEEKVESRKVMKGLYKKFGLCLFIVISLLLDYGLCFITRLLSLPELENIVFTNLTLAWLFIREVISNLENLEKAGIKLPAFIMKALHKTKEQMENYEKKQDNAQE